MCSHAHGKIGVTLPLGYLAGSPVSDDDHLLIEHCGSAGKFVRQLSERNVSSIEIRYLSCETADRVACKALETVLSADVGVTIHGSWAREEGKRHRLPLSSAALRLVRNYQPVLLTLHTCRGCRDCSKYGDNPLERNATLMRKIADEWTGESGLMIAVELNRNTGQVDPSCSYSGLVELQEKIGIRAVGLCWDIGHSQWNYLYAGDSQRPPPEFVREVVHTHIHEISEDEKTHWPLSLQNVPLSRYLQQLVEREYDGIYNLELLPHRWATVLNVREQFTRSVSLLQDAMDAALPRDDISTPGVSMA